MDRNKEILQEFGQLTVLDENKDSVVLSSLWKEIQAVLVFVRHFG